MRGNAGGRFDIELVSRLFLGLCALLFSGPFLLSLYLEAGFLDLANEPLAYRYFFVERLREGDAMVVGVGYLVSLIHHAVYVGLDLAPGLANATLETRLNLFALITNGLLTLLMVTVCGIAIVSPSLRPSDRGILGIAILAPVYGMGQTGFDMLVQADYPFANVVLCAATVVLFQFQWARRAKRPSRLGVLATASFVGLSMANKITMAVVAGVTLIPVIAFRGATVSELCLRAALAGSALVLTFALVHAAAYLFDLGALVAAASIWWGFVTNPGSQPEFWNILVRDLLPGPQSSLLAYSALVFTIALTIALRRKPDVQVLLTSLFCIAGALANVYFVLKRPAATTFLELTTFTLILSLVLLIIVSDSVHVRRFIFASCVGWLAICALTFPVGKVYDLIADSKDRARVKWDVFHEVLNRASGRPIEVVYPDDSYHHEGAFGLLLKAASDFPTWTITSGQKSVLDRYAPNVSFRHEEAGGSPPDAPYAGGIALVWFDRRDIRPAIERYPWLAEAVSRVGVSTQEWDVQPKDSATTLRMHLALLPPGPRPSLPPVKNFRAARIAPRMARLSWEPSGKASHELAFRSPPGPFQDLGWSQPGANEYTVGDLAQDAGYEFRIRPKGSNNPDDWVTVLLQPYSSP